MRIDFSANNTASSAAVMSQASGPSLSIGAVVSSSPAATHQIPARRSVPCSVSSSIGGTSSSKDDPSLPARGFVASLRSGSSRPPCIRWITMVSGSNSMVRYLPRRPIACIAWPYAGRAAEQRSSGP